MKALVEAELPGLRELGYEGSGGVLHRALTTNYPRYAAALGWLSGLRFALTPGGVVPALGPSLPDAPDVVVTDDAPAAVVTVPAAPDSADVPPVLSEGADVPDEVVEAPAGAGNGVSAAGYAPPAGGCYAAARYGVAACGRLCLACSDGGPVPAAVNAEAV